MDKVLCELESATTKGKFQTLIFGCSDSAYKPLNWIWQL